MLGVVKLGERYKAYYFDLNPSGPFDTYVADSADGELFVGPDQYVPLSETHDLRAISSKPGENCSFSIWRERSSNEYVAAISFNQAEFEIVANISVPEAVFPNDIQFDGSDIIVYGSRSDGNVNWNFGNVTLVRTRANAFNN